MSSIPAQRRPPPPQPSVNPWLIRLPILFIGGALLLGITLSAFYAAFALRYGSRIVPGVWSNGIELSGMTRADAMSALENGFVYDNEAVFTFRDGDHFWQVTAGQLGVSFDREATVEAAFSAGHSGNIVGDLFNQGSIWLNGRSIAPIVRYDQGIAVNRLLDIAAEINRQPANASLTLDGTQVITTPSQTGRALDINATLRQLDALILNMDTGAELPLVIHETPPTIWDAEGAASKVRAALSGPITLVADDQQGNPLGPWVASSDQIAGLLHIALADNGDGTQRYDVSVDIAAFQSFLESLAPGLIATPQDARFHFNPSSAQLEVIKPSVNGRTLNIGDTLARLEESIFNAGNRTVPMAFDYVQPRYHNNITAASLGITELVSQATTLYSGSTANRRANIIEAASRFDGVIIGPGEEFSFNTVLGDISPETGFVQGKIIFNGRTVDGVGGGVCQVSTTAFRAALMAGFPIIERHSHGYRVGFYELNSPPGFDAAIFQPTADFRFQNDTPYHLLIETSVYPGSDTLEFRFYSSNPGRKVTIEPPTVKDIVPPLPTVYESNPELQIGQALQVDWSAEGAYVTFDRVFTDLNGSEVRREPFVTQYQPWAAVIEVAPGDGRLG